jgi:hypothetical protein
MSIDIHTIEQPDGLGGVNGDRVILGMKHGIANVAGSGNGASVATAISGFKNLPASGYTVMIMPGQAAVGWVTSRTSTGFTVNLAPNDPGATLASGTFDVIVMA